MENYINDCLKGLKNVEIEFNGQFDFYFTIKPLNNGVLSEMIDLFDINVYKNKTYNKTENYLIGFNKFWNNFYIVNINLFESYLNSIYSNACNRQYIRQAVHAHPRSRTALPNGMHRRSPALRARQTER